MSKISDASETLGAFIVGGIVFSLFILYFVGFWQVIVDDHRYNTKDVVISSFFPFVPPWYGAKYVYRIATTSEEQRSIEKKCLIEYEAIGLGRNSRLRFCECISNNQSIESCKTKIYHE